MKSIVYILLVLISFSSWCQDNQKSYDKYYKAIEKGKYKRAERRLTKISLVENDNFILLLTKAHYYSTIQQLDSAALHLGNALDFAKYMPISFSSIDFKNKRDSLYRMAISIYDKIIQESPKAVHYCNRGVYKMDLGLHRAALDDFSSSIDLDSSDYMIYYNQAITYSRLNSLDSALLSYNKCLSINNQCGSAYLNKGFVYLKMSKFNKAIKEFNTARDYTNSTKEISYIINNIGYCYYGLSQYEQAKTMVVESININGINSYAYRNLALIEIALNNQVAACEAIENAIRLGYQNEYGSEILDLKNEHCN